MRSEQWELFLTVHAEFYDKAEKDPTLGPAHFAVYNALLRQWLDVACRLPLETFGRITASMAKVSMRNYYRCIRDLHDRGYLHYVSSHDTYIGSRIYLKWRGLGLRPEE